MSLPLPRGGLRPSLGTLAALTCLLLACAARLAAGTGTEATWTLSKETRLALEKKYKKFCKGIRSGGTLADPQDCRRFIICCSGKPYIQICKNCDGRPLCDYGPWDRAEYNVTSGACSPVKLVDPLGFKFVADCKGNSSRMVFPKASQDFCRAASRKAGDGGGSGGGGSDGDDTGSDDRTGPPGSNDAGSNAAPPRPPPSPPKRGGKKPPPGAAKDGGGKAKPPSKPPGHNSDDDDDRKSSAVASTAASTADTTTTASTSTTTVNSNSNAAAAGKSAAGGKAGKQGAVGGHHRRALQAEGGSQGRGLRAKGPPELVGQYVLLRSPNGKSSTGVSAQHAILLPGTTKVAVFSRHTAEFNRTSRRPIWPPGLVERASAIFDWSDGTYERDDAEDHLFCAGHSYLLNGTALVAGGEMNAADYPETQFLNLSATVLPEGRWSIRTLDARTPGFYATLPVRLRTPHWYPTQVTLPDGRVVIAGGYAFLLGPPNPTVEILNPNPLRLTTVTGVDFLQEYGWANLYPVMFHLPYTQAARPNHEFMLSFACDRGHIVAVSPTNGLETLVPLPPVPGVFEPGLAPGAGACTAFSSAGASVLLPLRPEDGYAAEMVLFGGHSKSQAVPVRCPCDTPALSQSFRLSLDVEALTRGNLAARPQWVVEDMPVPRNMGNAVLLPNGQVLLVNGAQFGKGGGSVVGAASARTPAYAAVLYNPQAPLGQRYREMAESTIKRLYHSTAMLLPSGDVLIMGSEHDECVDWCWQDSQAVYQRQAELFRPPYAFPPASATRPVILTLSTTTPALDGTVTVTFTGTVTAATLVAPSANTHQVDMSQRVVFLTIQARAARSVTLRLPNMASKALLQGPYLLFLLNGEVPCTRAAWVTVGPQAVIPPPVPEPPPVVLEVPENLQCGGWAGLCDGFADRINRCADAAWPQVRCLPVTLGATTIPTFCNRTTADGSFWSCNRLAPPPGPRVKKLNEQCGGWAELCDSHPDRVNRCADAAYTDYQCEARTTCQRVAPNGSWWGCRVPEADG